VLIISGDPNNRSSLRTVTVAVLSGNARLAALPGNVAISTEFAELEADSVVNVTQLATIDRDTLEERLTTLPDWLMAQVDAGLRRALALVASK
jgi:mRNA-degrading endonuclease toxin of MazEF toxin-antitoxin module